MDYEIESNCYFFYGLRLLLYIFCIIIMNYVLSSMSSIEALYLLVIFIPNHAIPAFISAI